MQQLFKIDSCNEIKIIMNACMICNSIRVGEEWLSLLDYTKMLFEYVGNKKKIVKRKIYACSNSECSFYCYSNIFLGTKLSNNTVICIECVVQRSQHYFIDSENERAIHRHHYLSKLLEKATNSKTIFLFSDGFCPNCYEHSEKCFTYIK